MALGAAKLDWNEPISGSVCGRRRGRPRWPDLRLVSAALSRPDAADADARDRHHADGAQQHRSDISGGYDGVPGITFKPLFGVFDYDLYGRTNYLYVLAVLSSSSFMLACGASCIAVRPRR